MNYEIVTSRWRCPDCNAPVKLYFAQAQIAEEESSDEYSCSRVLCEAGHPLPEDLLEEAIALADEEFYGAMERGSKTSETWTAPEPDQGMLPFERTI